MDMKRIAKDVHRLQRTLHSVTNGQASDVEIKWGENIEAVYVSITPNDGPYLGTTTTFSIILKNSEYPSKPPDVVCMTKIYHPNISHEDSNNVCVSLFDDWQRHNDLLDVVQALMYLLHYPNFDDPLGDMYASEETDHLVNIKKYVDNTLDHHLIEKGQLEAPDDGEIFDNGYEHTKTCLNDQTPEEIMNKTKELMLKRSLDDEDDLPNKRRRICEYEKPADLQRCTTVLVFSNNWTTHSVDFMENNDLIKDKPQVLKRFETLSHPVTNRAPGGNTLKTEYSWIQKQREVWLEKSRVLSNEKMDES